MEIGIDIVDIEKFKKILLNTSKTSFIKNHFWPAEIKDMSAEHLAGIYACKEAIYKTGYLPELNFLLIQIISNENGQPFVYDVNGIKVENLKISISHSNKSAVSVAILT